MTTRVILSRPSQFRLTQYILDKYTPSGMTDKDFAAMAAVDCKDEAISASHIWGIRAAFEIPSNRATPESKATERATISALEARIRALEVRLEACDQRVNVALTGSRK